MRRVASTIHATLPQAQVEISKAHVPQLASSLGRRKAQDVRLRGCPPILRTEPSSKMDFRFYGSTNFSQWRDDIVVVRLTTVSASVQCCINYFHFLHAVYYETVIFLISKDFLSPGLSTRWVTSTLVIHFSTFQWLDFWIWHFATSFGTLSNFCVTFRVRGTKNTRWWPFLVLSIVHPTKVSQYWMELHHGSVN